MVRTKTVFPLILDSVLEEPEFPAPFVVLMEVELNPGRPYETVVPDEFPGPKLRLCTVLLEGVALLVNVFVNEAEAELPVVPCAAAPSCDLV